ncbi:acylpyruvase FAHD1, mitochondrial [Tanacetum coccineum]
MPGRDLPKYPYPVPNISNPVALFSITVANKPIIYLASDSGYILSYGQQVMAMDREVGRAPARRSPAEGGDSEIGVDGDRDSHGQKSLNSACPSGGKQAIAGYDGRVCGVSASSSSSFLFPPPSSSSLMASSLDDHRHSYLHRLSVPIGSQPGPSSVLISSVRLRILSGLDSVTYPGDSVVGESIGGNGCSQPGNLMVILKGIYSGNYRLRPVVRVMCSGESVYPSTMGPCGNASLETSHHRLPRKLCRAQSQCRRKCRQGLPWTVAKGQDTFTPISSILSLSKVPDPHSLELWLKVDGEIRQKGSTEDMIFKIPYLISHISSMMTLLEGDVILTGTPKGVGPVKVGQKIEAGITGLLDIHFDVGRRQKSL